MIHAIRSAFFLVALALPTALLAADTPPARGVDRHLLSKLHHANQAEVALGQLAQEKGVSQEVRDYGAMLVKDHTAADEKVLATAQAANITLESPVQAKNAKEAHQMEKSKHMAAELKSVPQGQFDTMFKKAMIADHKHDVAAVSKAIPKLKNAEVRQAAEELLPTLKHHEKMAEELAKPTGGAS